MAGHIVMTVMTCMLLRTEAVGSCSIPLEPTRAGFVVSVQTGAAVRLRFLFDTGTSLTVLDARVADRLGIVSQEKLEALSTTGAVTAGRGLLETMRVGSLVRADVPVLILPLPHFPSHGQLDGILGADFMAGRSFLIDVKRRCLELDVDRPPGGRSLAATEVGGRVVLQTDGLNYVLDSAASFPVLMSERARSRAIQGQSFVLTSAAGRQRVRSGVIREMNVGTVDLSGLSAAFTDQQDKREDVLLPISPFTRIYVDAARRIAIAD